jgi:protein-S-isoprenylcysteine O-methyltransferase Ste14
MKYVFIASIWAAYCFLHSFLISTRFTKYLSRVLKNYYAFYRLFYVVISLVLLIWMINYGNTFDNEIIIINTPPWSIIRFVLTCGALLMFFYAFFFNYDSLSFFGIRQILNFGKVKEVNPDEAIKKNGLLGLTRHPMYLALIIYLWCQTYKMIDIVVNALLTIYIIIGTLLEEKKLILEFGDAYVKYQKQVPMLIPFLKIK